MKSFKNKPNLKLSATGKLLVAISLASLGGVSFAANIEAIGGTSVSQKGNVDVVGIVAPNEHGLSHNQYNRYNVSKDGAVLNNALHAGKSQLAGDLAANANLRDRAASVILNEVVSKNPSLIHGKQEIFGMAADYVLANPNGITYDGGSIINANRASLVVGKPEVNGGKLTSVRTDKAGSAALAVNGKIDGGLSVLDLIAPKVVVNAQADVSATQAVNVVSGSNRVGYDHDRVEKLAQDAKAPVLDGQVFGSMRAGSIRIHTTDSRATQKLEGATIQAGHDFVVNAGGDVHVKGTKLTGSEIVFNAQNTDIDGITSRKHSQFNNSRTEAHNVKVHNAGSGFTESYQASQIQAGKVLAFNNSGNVNIKGANIQTNQLVVDANNLNLAGERTTSIHQVDDNRSKGLWYNKKRSSERAEVLHTTNMNVSGDAVFNTRGGIDMKGAQVKIGGDATFKGAKGLTLRGETTRDSENVHVDFKNETAALKTGYGLKSRNLHSYHATQIQVGGNAVFQSANGNLDAAGAKVHTKGTLLTDVKRVILGTETTTDNTRVDDRMKFWGGIGGGKEGSININDQTLHGTSFTSDQQVILDADSGVSIHGSAVRGKNGTLVNAGAGKADIKHAVATDVSATNERVGTIFNITKKRSSSESSVQTATGSTLKSDADLTVKSDKEINVLGSSIQAAQKLQLQTAGNVNVAAAATHSNHNSNSLVVAGKLSGGGDIQKAQATVGLGISITKKSENSHLVNQNASELSGGSVAVQAGKDVNLKGSHIGAQGDVNINAQNINTSAAQNLNHTTSSQRVTDIGIGLTVSHNNGAPKVNVNAGISSAYNNTNTQASTAQTSGISGQNLNLNAQNSIKHQGTQLQATGVVNQNAQSISQTAAQNSVNTNTVEHKGGIGLDLTLDPTNAKAISGKLSIHGSGGKSQEAQSQAVVSQLQAGQGINVNATGNALDVGTRYNTAGNLVIQAQNYTNQAASNTASKLSNKGGAEISVSASTADLNTVDVNVGAKVHYAHENSNKTEAVKGQLNGGNVLVQTPGKATIAADINAQNHAIINAGQGITLTESKNTANSVTGGFNLGLDVGAKIVPAAGAAIPSVGVSADVNYANKQQSNGIGSQVQAGKGVVLTGGNSVALQGSNISAGENIAITADKITSQALTNQRNETGVDVGLNVKVGASASNVALGGKVNVKREQEVSHTANSVQGGEVVGMHANSKGNGLSLTGTQVTGKEVHLSNAGGNVHLGSVTGSLNKTNVGVGLNLSGGVENQVWKPNAGSANLNVDVARNQTHTGSSVQADRVQINAKDDLNLISSTINANTVGGNVGGDLNVVSQQNVKKEVALNLSAGASGSPAKIEALKPASKPATTAPAKQGNEVLATVGKVITAAQQVDNVVQAVKPIVQTAQKGQAVQKDQVDKLIGTGISVVAQNANGNEIVKKGTEVAKDLHDVSKVLTPVVSAAIDPANNKLTTAQVAAALDKGLELGAKVSPPKTNVVDVLRKDVANGSIMGVKAEAQASLKVEDSKTSQAAGITTQNNQLHVNGKINANTNQDSSLKINVGGKLTTNIAENIAMGVQHLQTGTSPTFKAEVSKSAQTVQAQAVTVNKPVNTAETAQKQQFSYPLPPQQMLAKMPQWLRQR